MCDLNLGSIERIMKTFYVTAIAFASAFALAFVTPAAGAATMAYTYIFTGSGAGTLAGNPFTDSAFSFVGLADPSTRQACGQDCLSLDFSSATVTLEGVGSFALVSATRVFNNQGKLGLSRAGIDGLDLLSIFPVPADYDFSLALGPVTELASLLQWRGVPEQGVDDVRTSDGALVFENGETTGSFEAKVAGVPLPGAVWLFGSALSAGRLLRRRRL